MKQLRNNLIDLAGTMEEFRAIKKSELKLN